MSASVIVYFLVKSEENWPSVRLTASCSLTDSGTRAQRRGERQGDPAVPSRREGSALSAGRLPGGSS